MKTRGCSVCGGLMRGTIWIYGSPFGKGILIWRNLRARFKFLELKPPPPPSSKLVCSLAGLCPMFVYEFRSPQTFGSHPAPGSHSSTGPIPRYHQDDIGSHVRQGFATNTGIWGLFVAISMTYGAISRRLEQKAPTSAQPHAPASDYWIFDFLASNFLLTPAAGTRRLGKALRDAAKYAADVNTKSEIAAAVTLAKSLRGRQTSINEFMNQFDLSPEAQSAVLGVIPDPAIAEERFRFDPEEFRNQVAFRSVQLDNGGLLTAESAEFDEVFTREVINARTNEVRYSTSGHIVSERLRKSQ